MKKEFTEITKIETREEFLKRKAEWLSALRDDIDGLCEEYLTVYGYQKADFKRVAALAVEKFFDIKEGELPEEPKDTDNDPEYTEKHLRLDLHRTYNDYYCWLEIEDEDLLRVTNEAVDYYLYTDERDENFDPDDPWKLKEGRKIPNR